MTARWAPRHAWFTVALGIALAAGPGRTAPLLSPGERMVFLGDSITEQQIYTRYVMNFFTLRYPGVSFSFRNAGWSGDTAPGGLRRLERDVLSLKPAVVSICFGMNDGGYTAFSPAALARYLEGMTGLVQRLQQAGVKVVLLTPGCVDPDRRGNGAEYNATLGRFAQAVKELAAQAGVPCADIYTLMLDVQARAKADQPGFTMIPDSVHPSPAGHLVMAHGLLKALGGDEPPAVLTLELPAGQVAAVRCAVSNLVIATDRVSFDRTDEALPVYVDPEAQVILKYLPFEAEFNAYRLTVRGLPPGTWRLRVADMPVGEFAAEELARGVDLGFRPGPWQELGKAVNELSRAQERNYFVRWRQVALALDLADVQEEKRQLMEKLDRLIADREARRIAATANRTWHWQLERVPAAGTAEQGGAAR